MDARARNRIAFANYAVAAVIAAWGAYLALMPLYPSAGDSHGGLLAVFSGLFVLTVALVPFCAGRLVQCRSRAAWPVQVLALGSLVGLLGYAIQ
jgi:hypothetical protein